MHTCADLIFLHQGNSPSKLSVQRTKPFLPRTQKGWRYSSDIGMGQNAWLFFVGGVLTLPSSPSERRRQIASFPAPCLRTLLSQKECLDTPPPYKGAYIEGKGERVGGYQKTIH